MLDEIDSGVKWLHPVGGFQPRGEATGRSPASAVRERGSGQTIPFARSRRPRV